MTAHGDDTIGNREWFARVGTAIRRSRTMLGLTQEQLARRARVSQRSVSRLERDGGRWTPLTTVVRVQAALRDAVRAADLVTLTPELRRLLDEPLPPAGIDVVPPAPLVADTLVDALARIALRVDRGRREAFLRMVEAAARSTERREGLAPSA